jgi:hypothetical protein
MFLQKKLKPYKVLTIISQLKLPGENKGVAGLNRKTPQNIS